MHASPAYWGYAKVEERNLLEPVMQRRGVLHHQVNSVSDMAIEADSNQFIH